jgi:hypothetical protein
MCSSCSLQGRFGVRLRCRGFRKGFHLFVANSMGVIPTGTRGLPGRQPRLPSSDRPVFGNIRYMSFASTTTIRFPEIHRPDRKPREARRSHSPKLSRNADKSFSTETVRLGISVFFTKLYSTLTNSLQNSPQAQPTFVVPITWTAINWE